METVQEVELMMLAGVDEEDLTLLLLPEFLLYQKEKKWDKCPSPPPFSYLYDKHIQ